MLRPWITNLLKSLGVIGALALVTAACGQAAAPTVAPPTPAATRTAAPTATTTAVPAPTSPAAVATATPAPKATPTFTTAPPTPRPAAVFGQLNVNANKIAGLTYPFSKPDFSLQPVKGGALKHASASVWPHFDPIQSTAGGVSIAVAPVYSRLIVCRGTLDQTSPGVWGCELGPQLASSWDTSPDGKTYTFHLRQGVKWQNLPPLNGRELTASDVKWSFEQFMKAGPVQAAFSLVDKMETPDSYTLKITLKSVFVDFLEEGPANLAAYILPHEVAEKDGDFKKTLVGTGPFQVKTIVGKERIVYQKNPAYFVPGAPFLDGIDYQIIADAVTTRAAFRAGAIHKAGDANTLSFPDMSAMNKTDPQTIFEMIDYNYSTYSLMMRLDKAPFNDPRVRRAMSMAIDRGGIAKDIFGGAATSLAPIPWDSILDKMPTFDQMPNYRYDPAAANKLLKDAGYPNGFKLKINYYPFSDVSRQMPVIVDDLKAIGLDVEVLQQDYTSFSAALSNRTYDQAIFGFVSSAASMDGYIYSSMYTNASRNYGMIADPNLDMLLEAQRSELNPAKRKDIFRQIWDMEQQNTWRIPISRPSKINPFSPKLHNYAFNFAINPAQSTANNLEYVWIDQ